MYENVAYLRGEMSAHKVRECLRYELTIWIVISRVSSVNVDSVFSKLRVVSKRRMKTLKNACVLLTIR